jgi:hypothetical protein
MFNFGIKRLELENLMVKISQRFSLLLKQTMNFDINFESFFSYFKELMIKTLKIKDKLKRINKQEEIFKILDRIYNFLTF